MDAATVNIPLNELLKAAHDIFLQKRLDLKIDWNTPEVEVEPKVQTTIEQWMDALNRPNNANSEGPSINEKDFIMNFIQKKKKRNTKTDHPLVHAFSDAHNIQESHNENHNKLLEENGLAVCLPMDQERRQRAIIWLMMDAQGDGFMEFSEFLALQRYGRLFDYLRN